MDSYCGYVSMKKTWLNDAPGTLIPGPVIHWLRHRFGQVSRLSLRAFDCRELEDPQTGEALLDFKFEAAAR